MRFAVQRLLHGPSLADRARHGRERGREKAPVRLAQLRSPLAAPDESLGFPDTIHEMRGGEIDGLQADVKPRERVSVVGW